MASKKTELSTKADSRANAARVAEHVSTNTPSLITDNRAGIASLKSASTEQAATVQRINMNATQQELETNEERGKLVGIVLSMLKSEVGQSRYNVSIQNGNVVAIKYKGFEQLNLHELLLDFYNYDTKPDGSNRTAQEMLKIREEFTLRFAPMPAIQVQNSDIEAEFDSQKACVITALMYVEGGSVLGITSVEELHHTLTTRFADSWGQYSDDAVIPSLYAHFGYTQMNVNGSRVNAVKTANKNKGMVTSAGHMVGFKKTGNQKYNFRDNETQEADADNHPKKMDQAVKLWYK